MNDPQFDAQGRLRHLLSLKNFPSVSLQRLLDRAETLVDRAKGGVELRDALAGRALCNLFFEPSTRTRSSFHLAAQRLGMDVLNFNASVSSGKKGETDVDTLRTLEAMGVDVFAVRHVHDGAVAELAAAARPGTVLINAGDGRSNHPTQGLLDMLTLRRHLGADFTGLKIAIVGDVKHSRVARSDLHALAALGCRDIRVCGPAQLLPDTVEFPVARFSVDLDETLEDLDAVIMLRLQRERMEQGLVPSLQDYYRDFGLNSQRLSRMSPHALVMHPGPMNRGVEIEDAVADGPQSVVLEQVANGLPVRMAVMLELLGG